MLTCLGVGECPSETDRLSWDFLQHKDAEGLEKRGGVPGIAEALRINTAAGCDPAATGELSIENRRQFFGSNTFKQVKGKNFFRLWFENLCDPTLILLMAAALVRCTTRALEMSCCPLRAVLWTGVTGLLLFFHLGIPGSFWSPD